MKKLVAASLLFSLAIISIRLFIIFVYGTDANVHQAGGILIGVVNEFAVGFLISFAFLASRNNRLTLVLVFLFFSIIVLLKITAFHYEAVFGHLPGAGIIYYLSELRNLDISIQVNLPVIAVILEFMAVTLVYLLPLVFMGKVEKSSSAGYLWGSPALLIIVISILLQLNVVTVPDRYYRQSREAVSWLVKSNFRQNTYQLENLEITEGDILNFLRMHGFKNPGPAISSEYPLCRIQNSSDSRPARAKNIILLLLEGVGMDEMQGEYMGRKLMPGLLSIAGENLSFKNIYASGSKSSQALTSIFSGLPAHPLSMYLWTRPLLTFNGFPQVLAREGYRTAYLHGGDLAFEHQRQYLNETGFQQLFEYELDEDMNSLAWGYDDRIMFNRLKEWVSNTGRSPYLAVLATLSTHDPYVLPEDWDAVFSDKPRTLRDSLICCRIEGEKNTLTAAAETYRFLDKQVTDFYNWYRENTSDTLLIITGDHPPILDLSGENTKSYEHDFRVPLVIAGLDEKSVSELAEFTGRHGGQHDFPSTIMHLLGLQSHECDLGKNLFAGEREWANDRYLYAVAGDSLDYLQIRHRDLEAVYDKTRGVIHYPDQDNTVRPAYARQIDNFLGTLLSVHSYLTENDAYAFRKAKPVKRESLPSVKTPIIISHRGNTDGTSHNPAENTEKAINNAIRAGFDWIEVDVRLTKDGIPVLIHDGEINIEGNKVPVTDVTYAELTSIRQYRNIVRLDEFVNEYSGKVNMLIEIKPVRFISLSTRITREVARIVNERPVKNRVIIDSFDNYLLYSIKNYCQCETGIDLPYGKKPTIAELRHAIRQGFDWIYVHHSVIDEELIETAHEMGLRVMAYTVNNADIISHWRNAELPDGIITDAVQLTRLFN